MRDPLSPTPDELLAAWAARVQADHDQVDRCREVADPADFYAPVANRFRLDPRRTDDPTLTVLLAHAEPTDTWLDIGSGGGRYALPLALRVREVLAVDPSPAMLAVMADDARAYKISNIRSINARWPMAEFPPADVALMAHVGYDIGPMGPFLDAAEDSVRRLCVAVMGESAMTTVATLFWERIHGEARVRLPALPELLSVLLARRRLPEVRLVDRAPPTFESVDEALEMARRQLWLRPGSTKDQLLAALVRDTVSQRDGRWAFEWQPTKIGVVSWPAGAAATPRS
jgi:SAM-dependent methyltransferase